MNKPKAIIVSGYFNPLHKGHLELFEKAKSHGDYLFVIVNNDYQRSLKGSREFMLEKERILIVEALAITDKTILSLDRDRTVRSTIDKICSNYGDKYELYFANGGDQITDKCPEASVCKKNGIGLIDGLGEKIQSSSWLLKK
jgi:cytidyltransferase-like protein